MSTWLEDGGGDLAACVKATGLPEPVCRCILGELPADGAIRSRRKLALRRR